MFRMGHGWGTGGVGLGLVWGTGCGTGCGTGWGTGWGAGAVTIDPFPVVASAVIHKMRPSWCGAAPSALVLWISREGAAELIRQTLHDGMEA